MSQRCAKLQSLEVLLWPRPSQCDNGNWGAPKTERIQCMIIPQLNVWGTPMSVWASPKVWSANYDTIVLSFRMRSIWPLSLLGMGQNRQALDFIPFQWGCSWDPHDISMFHLLQQYYCVGKYHTAACVDVYTYRSLCDVGFAMPRPTSVSKRRGWTESSGLAVAACHNERPGYSLPW